MSKGQESSNKKEIEARKLKKKKEKEQRKEERKSQSKSGSNLDDMIAYVDEDGNITTTPPDPTKKKVIREEDIRINVPKQDNTRQQESVRRGTVAFFNESKGYGFIKDQDSGDSIFVHVNGLLDPIRENNRVSFEVEMGMKGPNAVRVKLIH